MKAGPIPLDALVGMLGALATMDPSARASVARSAAPRLVNDPASLAIVLGYAPAPEHREAYAALVDALRELGVVLPVGGAA
jgi:hypothetical protein